MPYRNSVLRPLCLLGCASLLLGTSCPPNTGPTEVKVSVKNDGFTPVDFEITAINTIGDGVALSTQKPMAITAEPTYKGVLRLYGRLALGTAANNQYCFSLDVVSQSTIDLYFDRNHNGDLSDDNGPILNEGSPPFAATITVPFNQLVAESPFTSDFRIWAYTSDLTDLTALNDMVMRHYSRTQLKGTVYLGGTAYTAYLADRGPNDADLTNDGIYIDLNHDGAIDVNTEWFPSDQTVTLAGGNFIFRIHWQ